MHESSGPPQHSKHNKHARGWASRQAGRRAGGRAGRQAADRRRAGTWVLASEAASWWVPSSRKQQKVSSRCEASMVCRSDTSRLHQIEKIKYVAGM